MISVGKLIEELKKFPADALAYAYEGEIVGVVVVDNKQTQLGYVQCGERTTAKQEVAVLENRGECEITT